MRFLKPIYAVLLSAFILVSCGTSQTVTKTSTPTPPKTPEVPKPTVQVAEIAPMVAKKGEMTDAEIKAWPHMDIFKDSVPGLSLEKAYEFLNEKSSTTVVVGVIDSGIDIEHEDLKDVVWINEDEVAGNNKDDDNNGYVDDLHGWNFLGGKKGEDNPEQLELTRIVKQWEPRFQGKSSETIAAADTTDYKLYVKLRKIVDDKSANANNQVVQYTAIKEFVAKANDTIVKIVGKDNYSISEANEVTLVEPSLMQGKMIIMRILDGGDSVPSALDQLTDIVDHYSNQLNAQYKVDFNGRVAGDDPYDITDKYYGNGYVIGSKDTESHGTHVSGIIAAKRNNGIGMNGVANNVRIMALRAVPDGDEYDKDIALAIRYAVDNGAKVVNMSFGKSYSPNADWVFDAIKYAAEKDVLLVHAAGNDGSDIDTSENFPNDSKDKISEFADNVITVGAMTRHYDEQLVASFSNYGKKNVDVFAPGLEIYSTYPKDTYRSIQGTSMASPEVAGVAALIRSYFPSLTASQVKKIIMDSGIEYNGDVILPGSETEKVPFKNLSVSGKIINAYNALKMAEKLAKKS
ncbi:MAG: S8 family serine peptidase [Flavobacteriaceae bacterium]|nr:S8 family serine peptidase [Flavobacteriaceae bacterium]